MPSVRVEQRGEGLHIAAGTDAEAVAQWLDEYRASPRTQRAYRREAQRLLLWLAEQGRGLDELRRQHLDTFESFLADPQPAERWIGPVRPRRDPRWRPFRGPLSPASRRQSLVILQGMFAWLVEAGWVRHNPFRLMRDKRRRLDNRQGGIERYLERPLWDWLWGWLNRPAEEGASPRQHYELIRCRLVFGFAYLLAPRISEMSAARMNDFQRREGRWWWTVVGKGDKAGCIPVPPDMMGLLGEWRRTLGMAAEPSPDDASPLLRALDG
ncbi:MAG: site-specific integrase, partial [Halomonas sp.]|uniref:tyrosine-type recombinase/integrase n=1 Tax=Halomonas sp. TaxID=1486246 RepID=UPI002870481A